MQCIGSQIICDEMLLRAVIGFLGRSHEFLVNLEVLTEELPSPVVPTFAGSQRWGNQAFCFRLCFGVNAEDFYQFGYFSQVTQGVA
jgi:hypothetical protein